MAFYGRTGVDYRSTIEEGLQRVSRNVKKNIEEAALMIGEMIRERAHDKANVSPGVVGNARDGGHMRDKIEVAVVSNTPGKIEVRVGIDESNVPYAAHQEFGPHGKPFLRPAVDESRAEAHEILQSAMDGTALEDSSRFVRFVRGRAPSGETE